VCNALSLADASFLNHKISWDGGVLETECSEMLREFFKARR
jgi:tRNA(adenine34) deaminase